jgi:hypothetical protein
MRAYLILCCLFACTADVSVIEQAAGAHAALASSELFGLNVPADGSHADVASDLGARWARLELVDDSYGGELDPGVAARLASTLDDYHARGIRVLVLVDYATLAGYPGFGHGTPCGDWIGWRDMWLARIATVAQQFADRVDAWEVWNEPDQPMLGCGDGGYNPGMPAYQYGFLLRGAYYALASGAPIVTGGLDSGQVSYVRDASAAADGLYADAVAIHPYGVGLDIWCPDPGEGLSCAFGTIDAKLDDYFAATGLPIWITELGIATGDSYHQADYITGMYRELANRGDIVAHAFYFGLSDAMVAPFGLTDGDWNAKPGAYDAYRDAAR